jgi:enoyl-CoA hydratase/carnithine racemase
MFIEAQRDGRLLRLTLNRPEKRNALDLAMCREIVAALNEAGDDPGIGAVLLSAKGSAFCAGMDLTEAPTANPQALAEAHDALFTFHDWARKPVIAAVQGPALAGGTGVVANAHIVIASSTATFGLTEVRLGLWPVLIFPAIAAAMGERRATELALSGRVFGAADAQAYGLATEVVEPENLAERGLEAAHSIANASGVAIPSGLNYVREIRGKSTADALEIGRLIRDEIMRSDDFAEGVRAFREKRAAVWPSHRI